MERRRESSLPDSDVVTSVPVVALAINAAARQSAIDIAQRANWPIDDAQRKLRPAVQWLLARLEYPTRSTLAGAPPIIAQEHVDRLRTHLVRELAKHDCLDGSDVVRALGLLEDLADAWKRTDRGRFMARLTGSESASAVVAIAHDIRSPLSSILILVDSLRRGRGAAMNPIQERQLGLIYGAAQGLATLASDLIDAARGEELVERDPVPFSVIDVMHSVGAIVEPIAEEKNLELRLETPSSHARIGHPNAIHRALLNLTSNALRYTDVGSVTVGCHERSETLLEFSVQDTGRGLPLSVQQTLFDAFRPEQVAMRFSSAGLGLATVRALLGGMHSTLRVETEKDKGTRLSFDLQLPQSPR